MNKEYWKDIPEKVMEYQKGRKMEEIKVGEFIRTDDGRIYRLEDLEDELYSSDKFYNNIVKHSPILIDLIEEGDYVNGDIVVPIDYNEDEQGNYFNVLGVMDIDDDYAYPIELSVINIRTIVTKEQFASMEYKVKE